MPGTMTGVVTGFIERQKGRGLVENSALQRFGKGGALAAGGGNIIVGCTTAVGNGADTTEDVLFTTSLPANSLDIIGRNIDILAFGNITATSATKTVKVYFGSTVLVTPSQTYTFQATTTQTGLWSINATILKTGSSAQTIQYGLDSTITGSFARNLNVLTSPTESDTAAIVIKVTGQSSVATANLVTCTGIIISGFN